MAHELLDAFATAASAAGLLHAGAEELKRIKGMGGTAKRAELVAVLELARRAMGRAAEDSARCSARPAPSRNTCSCTWRAGRMRSSRCCSWMRRTG